MIAGATYEYIAGAIIRRCGPQRRQPGDRPGNQVAQLSVEGIADEAAALRPPCVTQFCVEIAGDQLDNLVFETVAALVREREVVRVGADPQLARVRRHIPEYQQTTDKERATAAGKHRATLLWWWPPSDLPWH